MSITTRIPQVIKNVAQTLENAGFEAYLVGGCVRDILYGQKPKDWDITTNAHPEQIQNLFPHTFYENEYGTVAVVHDDVSDETLKTVEVTPYRIEGDYIDSRHPQTVKFAKNLKDDLQRRDFTMNAIALNIRGELHDPYNGQKDIENKIIRTVGNPKDRFTEDALRILRAVRFCAELGFVIEKNTEKAIVDNAQLLENISRERIRDEFTKILMSDNPKKGLEIAHKVGILRFICPELEIGIGIEQGGIHTYDVWEHLIRSLQHTADRGWPLEVRLAALFHDIGKPATRKKGRDKWTFYGHEVVGTRITKKILSDLKFPKKVIEKVTKLVRWHMFFSDTEAVTHSAVRRLVTHVGKENIWDLMDIRAADRIGTGRPKENPYRLRKYHAMIDEVLRDPISVGMLKIDGKKIMELLGEKPGPKIGFILRILLEEVLEEPKFNTEDYLHTRAKELQKLDEKTLLQLDKKARDKAAQEEQKEIGHIHDKHYIK